MHNSMYSWELREPKGSDEDTRAKNQKGPQDGSVQTPANWALLGYSFYV